MGERRGYGDRFDDPTCVLPWPSGVGGERPAWSAGGPQGQAPEGPQGDLPWKRTFSVLLNSARFAGGKSMAFITSQSR